MFTEISMLISNSLEIIQSFFLWLWNDASVTQLIILYGIYRGIAECPEHWNKIVAEIKEKWEKAKVKNANAEV